MLSTKQKLLEKFELRQARIAVIGLGYVGLPLCVAFAKAGYEVIGIDVDGSKVDAINRGESYIEDISSETVSTLVYPQLALTSMGLMNQDEGLKWSATATLSTDLNAIGSLRATTDYAVLAECDAVSICVPTPLSKTGDPNMAYIVNATEQIAKYIHSGMVVVLESTTYPRTTTEVVLPILASGWQEEKMSQWLHEATHRLRPQPSLASPHHPAIPASCHLQVGQDFFLAFSPERIDPGREDWTVENMPKVMGGVTPDCQAVATAYYGQAVGTLVPVSSPDAAELVKLFENTFRSVNIALANELLLMCDKLGLDAWEVLEAADTKPFGFMKFTPGPGLGGHCIPVDPHYLSWKLRTVQYNARFIELASEINTSMPNYWVQKTQDLLNDVGKSVKGSHILILGVAYKRGVSDLRESPALDIIHLLQAKGAIIDYHDPFVPSFSYDGLQMARVADLDRALEQADCVLIATDHDQYDWTTIAQQANQIVDTRHKVNV